METHLNRGLNRNVESHSEKAFITFYNYIDALRIARKVRCWSSAKIFLTELKNRNTNIQRRQITSEEFVKLRTHLMMLWNREAVLHQLKTASDDHISMALQSLFQDLYYVFFHAGHAYLTASGKPSVEDHASLIKVLSRDIARFPGHLSATCFLGENGELMFSGFDDNLVSSYASNLSTPNVENFQLHLRRMLKSTREGLLEKKLEKARERLKVKRLSAQSKHKESKNLEPVTIIHFLFRLRCRFDYSDAETLCSIPDRISPRDFYIALHDCFCELTICLEWLCARYVGPKIMREARDYFEKRNNKNKLVAYTVANIDYRLQAYFLKDVA